MAGLTADHIIERIANANGVEPAVMRQQIEQALQNIIADTTQPHSFMLADLFSGGKPTVDVYTTAPETRGKTFICSMISRAERCS